MSTAAVVRARFPRATADFNRYVDVLSRGLDETGRMAWFSVCTVGQTVHALRYYRRETARQIVQTVFGAGAMAFVGGAVGIGGFVVLSGASLVAIQGFVSLGNIGVESFTGFFAAVINVRIGAPVIGGILLASIIGAGHTAELGAMRISEEIDALQAIGIPIFDYLVLPRVSALTTMMPLLCMYAGALGLFGGFAVTVTMMNMSAATFVVQLRSAVGANDILLGLAKSIAFGSWIAIAGCRIVLKAGRSATDVGHAATAAAVSGIVGVIALDALFDLCASAFGL